MEQIDKGVTKIGKPEDSDLPLATDGECQTKRKNLIKKGFISSNKHSVVNRGGVMCVSTEKSSRKLRTHLIGKGLIDPELQHVPKIQCSMGSGKEEGEYHPTPITSQDQYDRKRILYFRVMQEILHSRRDLKLILAKKQDSDPDWIF